MSNPESQAKGESGKGDPQKGKPDERLTRTPSEEELAKFPRWARVAFAVRCAQRVQPLFVHCWPEAPRKYIDAIDRAVRRAAVSAVQGHTVAVINSADEAEAAAGAANAATRGLAGIAATDVAHAAASAAKAAAYAALHVGNTAFSTYEDEGRGSANRSAAADSATLAYTAATTRSIYRTSAFARVAPKVLSAIWRDFDTLLALAKQQGWTDASPVDPDLCGPLWPEGVPEGWPNVPPKARQALHLRFAVPPANATAQDIAAFKDKLKKLILAANQQHIAAGGSGFDLANIRTQLGVGDPVPSGGER